MQSVILLVEPNKLFAQTVSKALVAKGYKVNVAASAQAAIASADEQRPDLVILEIELAKHNGVEFLHEFRSYSDFLSISVIIYSNVSPGKFAASQKELKLLGIRQYLYKPKSSLASLTSAVASELEDANADN